MGKKSNPSNASLGKQLIKRQKNKTHQHKTQDAVAIPHHTTEFPDQRPQLSSILDQNSLEEFISLAQLSQKQFESEKQANVVLGKEVVLGNLESSQVQANLLNAFLSAEDAKRPRYQPLKLPRRPKWKSSMSAQELNLQENTAFLEWRRDLAKLEEGNVNLAITPFEKNVEVWRQLWRVLEKADILLQIVDARNPFFFYSADLEKYIKELDEEKEFMLLINKADYLTDQLREHWSSYFKEKNVNHIFFSALWSQSKLDSDISDDQTPLQVLISRINSPNIFGREDVLTLLSHKATEIEQGERLVVGMVGYPNVGKSSVINVLCGKKKVGVAAMPGKTKHFQTINLEGSRVTLCDCPGLVFPSFANSKAEMVCCGVLPIDKLKDYHSPIQLVVNRVNKEVLEKFYKIKIPSDEHGHIDGSRFLQVFAAKKGYVTGNASPNESQAARVVLKDYVNGRLLFCHLRPDYSVQTHGHIDQCGHHHQHDEEEEKEEHSGEEEGKEETKDDTFHHSELQKMAQQTAVDPNSLEAALDQEFFAAQQRTIGELKLNKGEKRALKFAMARGVDIEKIGNLKEFLAEMMRQGKGQKKHKNVVGVKSLAEQGFMESERIAKKGNNSNKVVILNE